ncbi:MAG: hypothetical protein MUC54_05585 [Chloroflexi bacterium]|jgi:hypothetical protein|nr:hypothetical protein [Chloroflexota bacterium]
MERSIAARYSSRPPARFVPLPQRERERRLGLVRRPPFRLAADQPTVLRHLDLGPVSLLRPDWRALGPLCPQAPAGIVPAAHFHWAKLGGGRAGRRTRAASAPWRG